MTEYKSKGKLERLLYSGNFVVTTELGPPRGCNDNIIREKGRMLKDRVDAINITDNQTAVVRMSSLASAVILKGMGLEPVMRMVTRDRNRIAMQSDILGAAALGISNLLCISGDHQCFGNQPRSRNINDLDSIQLVRAVKLMRDEGHILDSDDNLLGKPEIFIGAAANPFADPVEFRPFRLRKKIEAGADFIQTQCIFDLDRFKEFMSVVSDMGLDEKTYILAGVTPLKTAGMARYMANRVPGISIPDNIIRRMENVSKEKAAEEGIRICCEQIQALREIKGVHGIHIMAIEWEHKVGEIVERAGLFPRPE